MESRLRLAAAQPNDSAKSESSMRFMQCCVTWLEAFVRISIAIFCPFRGVAMWKRALALLCLLTLIMLLDPTLTPAQPPGFGKGDRDRKSDRPSGDRPSGDRPSGTPGFPSGDGKFGRPSSTPGGTPGGFPAPGTYTFTAPGGAAPGGNPMVVTFGPGGTSPGGMTPGGMPPGGMSPGGMSPGGFGGNRPRDPERSWSMLVNMTGSDGTTVDQIGRAHV